MNKIYDFLLCVSEFWARKEKRLWYNVRPCEREKIVLISCNSVKRCGTAWKIERKLFQKVEKEAWVTLWIFKILLAYLICSHFCLNSLGNGWTRCWDRLHGSYSQLSKQWKQYFLITASVFPKSNNWFCRRWVKKKNIWQVKTQEEK